MTTFEIIQSSTSYTATKYPVEKTTNSIVQQTTTASRATTTIKLTDATPTDTDIEPDESGHFILIPLAVLLFIVAFSALVFLIGRNRRRLAKAYCRRRNEYKHNFEDYSNSLLERGDFDDPSECLLKGKLQIDNSYNSTLRKGLYT
ncbi:uncharacterized protein LOC105218544 [Zeugodacus cucurbitae]|uniref:uncharacterized protein LOC105218544 n=1 Tax=Zeugodacus cucurbitae TaxID=28588 RepID=UPI0005969652|nr:uncharacterized protein LOC105218544 [Zeugodacus cucurbitae]